jgi:hypothetical protein
MLGYGSLWGCRHGSYWLAECVGDRLVEVEMGAASVGRFVGAPAEGRVGALASAVPDVFLVAP